MEKNYDGKRSNKNYKVISSNSNPSEREKKTPKLYSSFSKHPKSEGRKRRLKKIAELLSNYPKSFREKILFIENLIIINSIGQHVHTLPYMFVDNDIVFEEDEEIKDRLLELMCENSSIIFVDDITAKRIMEHDIHVGYLSGLINLLENYDGKYYIKQGDCINLDDDPHELRVINKDINILDILKINEPQKDSLKSTTKTSKYEAYNTIRILLNEYNRIVSERDFTQGKRLNDCIYGIFQLLRLFPEYISEDTIRKNYTEASFSDSEMERYDELLGLYSSIEDEPRTSMPEQTNYTIKSELDEDSDQVIDSNPIVDSEDNTLLQDYEITQNAKKILALSHMAELISSKTENEQVKAFFAKLTNFFNRTIIQSDLSEDEKKGIKEKLIGFENRPEAGKYRSDELKREYLNRNTNLISEGKIGEIEYVKIGGSWTKETIIHTLNGVYKIYVDDNKSYVKYSHEFFKGGKRFLLDVEMPTKSGVGEKVWLTKPNGEDEIYNMIYGGYNYSICKKGKGVDKTYYYGSKYDIFSQKPCKVEYTDEKDKSNNVVNTSPSVFDFPELDNITLRAIKYSIVGVIPRDILELYRTINPQVAGLIDDYGVDELLDLIRKNPLCRNNEELERREGNAVISGSDSHFEPYE